MDNKEMIVQQLKQQKLLPLFYHEDTDVCIGVTTALYAAGIRMIEFTNRSQHALTNFKALVKARNEYMEGLLLAVGTVRSSDDAEKFISAGADFLVSPFFDSGVSDTAKKHNIFWIPGCMTPAEIYTAEMAGCNLIKLFPGNLLGPAFIKSIRDLFPALDFMPTGGVEVSEEKLSAWFNGGACAVGIGSQLLSKKLLDAHDYERIEKETRRVLEIIHSLSQKA